MNPEGQFDVFNLTFIDKFELIFVGRWGEDKGQIRVARNTITQNDLVFKSQNGNWGKVPGD
ncbi:hypothetical protein ACFFUR_02235 [Echinicola jeungdonensis]|uniref:Galectin n=1 Tax=Echinicola jeungdonensis TaxID=709343 RepID=A0ABV5J319_9BACT